MPIYPFKERLPKWDFRLKIRNLSAKESLLTLSHYKWFFCTVGTPVFSPPIRVTTNLFKKTHISFVARLIVVGETKESLYCFWSICRVLLCLNKHSIPIDALLGGNNASFFWKPLHIRAPCCHTTLCVSTRPCLERTEISSSRTCFALVRGVYLRNLIGKLCPLTLASCCRNYFGIPPLCEGLLADSLCHTS